MALKIHCDGCDRVIEGAAVAATSAQTLALQGQRPSLTVFFSISRGDSKSGGLHLCHPCRKALLTDAISTITTEEWWDPK